MRKVKIEKMQSGFDNGCIWVSIGFIGVKNPRDVLHIVVPLEISSQDRELEQDTIYLERTDQLQSCYGGCEGILVDENRIVLELNSFGMRALGFDESLEFSGLSGITGNSDARRRFEEMSEQESGATVSVAKGRSDG